MFAKNAFRISPCTYCFLALIQLRGQKQSIHNFAVDILTHISTIGDNFSASCTDTLAHRSGQQREMLAGITTAALANLVAGVRVSTFFRRIFSHGDMLNCLRGTKSFGNELKHAHPRPMLSARRPQATPASLSWHDSQAGMTVHYTNHSAPLVHLCVNMRTEKLCTECFTSEPRKERDKITHGKIDTSAYAHRIFFWTIRNGLDITHRNRLVFTATVRVKEDQQTEQTDGTDDKRKSINIFDRYVGQSQHCYEASFHKACLTSDC